MESPEPVRTKPTIVASIDEMIGETPLLRLDAFADNLLGKVEGQNPYSVKDRIAREIVAAAERDGALEPGGTCSARSARNSNSRPRRTG